MIIFIFPPFLSPDQREPENFLPFETVTSLLSANRQDSHFVTPIGEDRPLKAEPD